MRSSWIVCAIIAICLAGCTNSQSETPTTSAPGPSTSATTIQTSTESSAPAVPFDESRAAVIGAGLGSDDASALSAVVVLPSGATLSPDVLSQLKGLGPVTFDPATFRDNGDGTATVTATTAAGAAWTAYLLLFQGEWTLAASEELHQ